MLYFTITDLHSFRHIDGVARIFEANPAILFTIEDRDRLSWMKNLGDYEYKSVHGEERPWYFQSRVLSEKFHKYTYRAKLIGIEVENEMVYLLKNGITGDVHYISLNAFKDMVKAYEEKKKPTPGKFKVRVLTLSYDGEVFDIIGVNNYSEYVREYIISAKIANLIREDEETKQAMNRALSNCVKPVVKCSTNGVEETLFEGILLPDWPITGDGSDEGITLGKFCIKFGEINFG